MQSNVVVGDTEITGTLHYVTGYTGFHGSDTEQQKGNFLALKFEFPEDANGTVELVGGTSGKGPVPIDEDMNFVGRITSKDTQQIKVVVTRGTDQIEKVYGLSGLTLESEAV